MRRMKLIAGLLSIAMAVPMLNLLSTGKSVRAFSGGENTITSVTLNNSRGMTPTPTNTPTPTPSPSPVPTAEDSGNTGENNGGNTN